MLAAIAVIVTFAAALASAFLTVVLVEAILERRSEDVGVNGGRHAAEDTPVLLRDESLSAISLWGTLLERLHFHRALKLRIAQAQLNWTVGRLTAMMLFSGTATIALLSGSAWLPAVGVIGAALMATVAPYLYVMGRRSRWMGRFEESFPDALDEICRALRAGHPLASALDSAAGEAPPAVAVHLRRTVDELRLGMPWEQAMNNLVTRVPLVDVAVFAAAVKLHTRTGGRLTDVLAKVSDSMREAVALRGEVRAIAAQGKLAGNVLTVMPVVIAIAMTLVNPEYLRVLLYHPLGKTVIAAAVCALVLARLVIRKMVDVHL